MNGSSTPLPLLRPRWTAPRGVGAAMSQRAGGVSGPPFDTLNLSFTVGDADDAVAENRRRFAAAIGARPVWLRLVHGVVVLRLDEASPGQALPQADAAWTTARGVACIVTAADCLPVLLAAHDGSVVAAVHAGWRGLAAGVLEATLRALQQGAGASPPQLQAWLGPCIGPRRFEVGPDVLQAFGVEPQGDRDPAPRFVATRRNDGSPAWRADLAGLAHDRLAAAGVATIVSAAVCTVEDAAHCFSYRRDRVSGRMAAAIWRL